MYFILNTKVDKMSTGYHYFSSEKKTFVYEPQTNVFESSAVFPLPGTRFDCQVRVSQRIVVSGNEVICVKPSNLTLL